MKNILVTRGCGFIGSNFINTFFQNHHYFNIINLDALYYCSKLENIGIEDRNNRVNLLGSDEYERIISRSEFYGNILSDYYIYCKPLIIDNIKNVIKGKLEIDITDEIPSEYSQYYSLTDHL